MPRPKKEIRGTVKTKVISARVTETVYELLRQKAEDAGMSLSEFSAQMLTKGRVNTSYVFYVHPDEIESLTREFAAIGNNLNQIAARLNSSGEIDGVQLKEEIEKLKAFRLALMKKYIEPEKGTWL